MWSGSVWYSFYDFSDQDKVLGLNPETSFAAAALESFFEKVMFKREAMANAERRPAVARRYKNPTQQTHYDTCRKLARDPASELFRDGTPRLGSNVRVAYWKGRDGKAFVANPTSAVRACWDAGVDDRKELGPPPAPVPYNDFVR